MGQGEGKDAQASPLEVMQEKITRHATELKQAALLPYDQFIGSLVEINKITSNFSDISGKKLVFQIRKGTDASMLWRGTVRIKCHKVNATTGMLESTRVLNLKHYVRLYNEITLQASMSALGDNTSGSSQVCASIIFTQFESAEPVELEECCICMDRQARVILPCNHLYCEQCIDEWLETSQEGPPTVIPLETESGLRHVLIERNVNNKTCPICRAAVQGDDTWVLTEKPDKGEMAYETTGYLMGLADRTGSPAHSPSD